MTGATGFLGSHLMARLATICDRLRALVRPSTPATQLERIGVEIHRGDLLEADEVGRATAGCTGVIHCGALAGWVRDPSRYEAVNVDGTANVLAAARRAGVDRVVHTSSVVTIGEEAGRTAREETSHRGWFLREYERTKVLAERLAAEAAAAGLPVVITNPTGIVGPGSTGLTAQALGAYLERKLPTLPDPERQINLVHVGDVVDGTLAAYARGRVGERYLLGGTNATIGEVFACCERLTGIPAPTRSLPRWLETVVAGLFDLRARITGRAPPLSRDLLRVARHGMIVDSSKARQELGYDPRGLEEALSDTLRWLARRAGIDLGDRLAPVA